MIKLVHILITTIASLLLVWPVAVFSEALSPYLNPSDQLQLKALSGHEIALSPYKPYQIQFGRQQFNLVEKTIIKQKQSSPLPYIAKVSAQSFNLRNWDNEYLPLLNNTPLRLQGKSLAISIKEDETQFVIASDQETVLFSNSGKRIWSQAETELSISVLISPDHKYVINRYANGVTQWRRYTDGKVLFSLFLSPSTNNWIIWTPEGYYDSSNPFFTPLQFDTQKTKNIQLAQLRAHLFRPDIIHSIVSGQIESPTPVSATQNNPVVPSISFSGKLYETASICIETPEVSQHKVLLSNNGVTIKNSLIKAGEKNLPTGCQHQAQLKFSPYNEIREVGIRAISTSSGYYSKKLIQKVDFSTITPTKNHTAVLILTPPGKNRLSQLSIAFNQAKPKTITKKQFNQELATLNRRNTESIVLYIAASCDTDSNDIYFKDNNGKTILRLNQLSQALQNLDIVKSLIVLDCIAESKKIDFLLTKRLIHNFIANTGRSIVSQFITREHLKLSAQKQSILENTLHSALLGDADLNDDLVINSNELLTYLQQTLELNTFEYTGSNGVVFIHNNSLSSFDLPLKLND